MTHNATLITEAMWRQLPAGLPAQLRWRLGHKAALVDHQVLDVARALCALDAYGLAMALYDALEGEPLGSLPGLRPGVADEPTGAHGRGPGADR